MKIKHTCKQTTISLQQGLNAPVTDWCGFNETRLFILCVKILRSKTDEPCGKGCCCTCEFMKTNFILHLWRIRINQTTLRTTYCSCHTASCVFTGLLTLCFFYSVHPKWLTCLVLYKIHFELGIKCTALDNNDNYDLMISKHTHLFSIVLLQQSKYFTQRIRTAPFCWEQASRNGHADLFGSRVDFLAEVCVQNNITAETLHGQTLPAKRYSSLVLDLRYSSCFRVYYCILCLDSALSYCVEQKKWV